MLKSKSAECIALNQQKGQSIIFYYFTKYKNHAFGIKNLMDDDTHYFTMINQDIKSIWLILVRK